MSATLTTPITQFIAQIHQSAVPYSSLPAISTTINLVQDPSNRFVFTYYGISSVGNSPYRHFSLWDSWMQRGYSVYVMFRRRKSSIHALPSSRRESFDMGLDGARNEEIKNALTAALVQLQAKSLPSIDITI